MRAVPELVHTHHEAGEAAGLPSKALPLLLTKQSAVAVTIAGSAMTVAIISSDGIKHVVSAFFS